MPAVDAAVRLRRLLAIIPWLAARGSATVSEVAERFGLTEKQVEDELTMASMCGLPPYTADTLVELMVFDDEITARVPDYFRRPPQLSAADGFAVVAAGRALLAVPGSDDKGPLASAIDKVEAALGGPRGVTIELDQPPFLDALRDAVEGHDQVQLTYYSASRDADSDRAVDPYRVFSEAGRWYLVGWCHSTSKVLTFRVDRVRAVEPTGDRFEAPEAMAADADVFHPGPDTEAVVIDLPERARWVVESYPTDKVEGRPDGLRVTLALGGTAFLERLLLRAGAEARVVQPAERAGTGAAAARRILERYATSAAGPAGSR